MNAAQRCDTCGQLPGSESALVRAQAMLATMSEVVDAVTMDWEAATPNQRSKYMWNVWMLGTMEAEERGIDFEATQSTPENTDAK